MKRAASKRGGAAAPLPAPFHGWRIVWTLAVTETISYGVLYYAFSALVVPMERELGWSRAQTSLAFSLSLLVSGLAAPFVGRAVDRSGPRLLMAGASTAGALLVLAWSRVSTLPALYALFSLLGVVMAGVFYEPAFATVARWFRRHRARAMLVITLVAGLASTIFVPLTTWLVDGVGWRKALVVLSALLAVGTALPHALVLRRRPEDVGQRVDGEDGVGDGGSVESVLSVSPREALRGGAFWRLAAAFSLAQFTAVAVAAHLVPLLLERGHPAGVAALAAGGVGLAALPGRAVFAPLLARLSLAGTTAAVFGLRVAGLVALVFAPGAWGLWVFVGLFGASNGLTTLVRATTVAERYGAENYGAIGGALALVVSIAQAFAPFAVGGLHAVGGYGAALPLLLALALLAWGMTLGEGRRGTGAARPALPENAGAPRPPRPR